MVKPPTEKCPNDAAGSHKWEMCESGWGVMIYVCRQCWQHKREKLVEPYE